MLLRSMTSAPAIVISMLILVPMAHAQVSLPPPPEKTEPRPLYAPWTGPGFGNPDSPHDSVGRARKTYNDASGAPAYSPGGNPEATPPEGVQKPKKPKKTNLTTKPPKPASNERQPEK